MTHLSPVERLRDLILTRYVLEDVAPAIAAQLDGVGAADLDPEANDPREMAAMLTERLRRAYHDLHLRVRYQAQGALETADTEKWEARATADARRHAGGIKRVGRLPGGVGLLEISPVMSPVHLAGPYVAGAFAVLSGCDRLIIDMRGGLGSFPDTIAYVCSHLLGHDPVHLQDVEWRDGHRREYWTTPAGVLHPIGDDVPIHVLTSSRTFSGAEELTYNLQTQQRATIVGERTAGGAHPSEAFRISDTMAAYIPVARPVNAVTGLNWEGTGVTPDVACAAEDALDTALQLG